MNLVNDRLLVSSSPVRPRHHESQIIASYCLPHKAEHAWTGSTLIGRVYRRFWAGPFGRLPPGQGL